MRALQLRHEATTLSQVCSPPRDRGTTWSTFSAGRWQYWQRCPSRAKIARREHRHPGPERHPHVVDEADDRRHRERGALRVELVRVARDDLGLLLQHEDHGAPDGHDAERLEAGVEEERSSQAFETSVGRRRVVPGSLPVPRPADRRAEVAAPPQVLDDVARRRGARCPAPAAVLRRDPEPHVGRVGQGQVRGPAPPPGRAEPQDLGDRRRPQPRAPARRRPPPRSRTGWSDGFGTPRHATGPRHPPGRRARTVT